MSGRNDEEEPHLLARAAIGAALIIVLFVVLYDYEPTKSWICMGLTTHDSCMRALLSEFQTLIAGVFAVFAAWWTVDTMNRTDKAAERRHDDLVRLQTRSDKLVVERFLIKHLPTLQALSDELCATNFSLAEVADPSTFKRERAADLILLRKKTGRVIAIPPDPKCAEARALFGGHLTEELDLFFTQVATLDVTITTALGFATVQEEDDSRRILLGRTRDQRRDREELERVRIALIPVHVDEAYRTIAVVLNRLRDLAQTYKIDLP